MENRYFRIIILLIFLLLINHHRLLISDIKLYTNPLNNQEIKNGDIIFRKGKGINSNIVSMFDSSKDFTHVGIIWIDNNKINVIHSIPEENGNKNGVIVEPLNVFSSSYNATIVGLYRSNIEKKILLYIVQDALKYVGKPFDSNFNLFQQDEFYCSELVWFVFQYHGYNLVDKFANFNLPLLETKYFITIDSLKNSKLLKKIY